MILSGNGDKNELFTFIDRLITLHNDRKHDEIEKVLIGVNEGKISRNRQSYNYKNTNGAKYVDENSIVDVRVRTDEETKTMLKILHYICGNDNACISLNNKMVKWWLYLTNNELSKFTYRNNRFECKGECRLTLKIEYQLWKDFTMRCEGLDISIPRGFKVCLNEFIEQRARVNL